MCFKNVSLLSVNGEMESSFKTLKGFMTFNATIF